MPCPGIASKVTRGISIVLVVGLVLLAVVIGLTLLQSPVTVIKTNGILAENGFVKTRRAASACQSKEVLPAGTSAIRLALGAQNGPRVAVSARSGDRVLARGNRRAGWTGGTVTVPIRRLSHAAPNAAICFTVDRPIEALTIFGKPTPQTIALTAADGQKLFGRMAIEYLRPRSASWFSLLRPIARRMGLGHAWSGSWIALALLVVMASIAALSSWLVLRELG
jgi:hypothetical protein